MTEIQYKKAVTDGRYSYHHPFAVHARPTVGLDAQGKLVIYAGKYHVSIADSAIGIVDKPASSIRSESLPSRPNSFIQLGTLEWIRYQFNDAGVTRTRTLRFPGSRTSIERDEKGNLHVVQNYVFPHEEIMKRRTRARRNPVKIEGEGLKAVAMAAVGVGLVGAVLAEGADKFIGTRIFGYKKAGLEVLGGIGLAYAASRMKAPGEVVLGIGGTGVLLGARDAVHTWQASRAALPAPVPQTPAPTTPPKPGAYALGPGGMPQGYGYVNRAACGVRR